MFIIPGVVKGQTTSTYTGTGKWHDAANWSAGIPTTSTNAVISSGAIVTADQAAACRNMTLQTGANLEVSNTVTLDVAGSILTNSSSSVTLNSGSILNIATGWSTTAGTFTANTSTVNYTSTSGFTSGVRPGTYHNLGITGSILKQAKGNLIVNGELKVANGAKLDMSNNELKGSFTTSGTGLLMTSYTSAQPVPANKTWTFNVEFYSNNTTVSTTVPFGVYNNLSCKGTGPKTLSTSTQGVIEVNGNLNIESGTTFDLRTFKLYGTLGSTSGTGVLQASFSDIHETPVPEGVSWTFDVNYQSSGIQLIAGGTYTKLNASGGDRKLSETASIRISGAFVAGSGNYIMDNSTVEYVGDTRQSIAVLPGGASYYNLVLSGNSVKTATTLSVSNLITINSGSSLDCNSDFTISDIVFDGELDFTGIELTINGSISGSGTFICDASSSLVIGSDVGKFPFATGSTEIGKLTIKDGGVFLIVSELTISPSSGLGEVVLEAGARLETSDLLTLGSDANGTARIAAIPTSDDGTPLANLSGSINAQKYVPGKRTFRFMSHPFASDIPLDAIIDNFDITGSGGANNGFTPSGTNNPSSFWYNEVTDNWVAFSNTNGVGNNAWHVGQGIRVMIRGNKGEGLTTLNYSPSSIVFDFKGPMNIGDVAIPLTSTTTGHNLIGNPYPSPINLMPSLSEIAGEIDDLGLWVWNPAMGDQGGYSVWSFDMGDYYLPAYSSFFLRVAASTDLVFKEEHKVAEATEQLYKTQANKNLFQLTLMKDSLLWDQLYILNRDTASANREKRDVRKMFNPDGDLYSISADNYKLSLDARHISSTTTLPIGIRTTKAGNYSIEFNRFPLADSLVAFLHDQYLNTVTPIFEGDRYDFSMTTNAATQGAGRFKITFSANALLAADDVRLTAAREQEKVRLIWENSSEKAVSYYRLERSEAGNDFKEIARVKADLNNGSKATYTTVDDLNNNDVLYRVATVSQNGNIKYSEVVKLMGRRQSGLISVFPNPVVGSLAYLDVKGVEEGRYTLKITDVSGKLVGEQKIDIVAGQQASVDVGGLNNGLYYLMVEGRIDKVATVPLLIVRRN